jgi:aspartate/tyrosine/aromatic aminotransferase
MVELGLLIQPTKIAWVGLIDMANKKNIIDLIDMVYK